MEADRMDFGAIAAKLSGAQVVAQKCVHKQLLSPKNPYSYCPVCADVARKTGTELAENMVLEVHVYKYIVKLDATHGKIGKENRYYCRRCQRYFEEADFLKYYGGRTENRSIIPLDEVEAWLDERL